MCEMLLPLAEVSSCVSLYLLNTLFYLLSFLFISPKYLLTELFDHELKRH